MTVAVVTTLCALVGLIFLLQARRHFRRRRLGSCALHGLSSLVFFLAAACAALIGFDLMSYDRLTREQPALEAQFTRVGEQQFDAVLTYPSGATQRYVLRGDDWQVDARVLKWHGAANVLGFDTAYRLERVAGRYADIDRERNGVRTVYALAPPERVDVWALVKRYHAYLPWVDTLYGSAAFMPMADGARYEIKVSQSGLVARPLNVAAREAVGAWH
jgi:hypothetical protein